MGLFGGSSRKARRRGEEALQRAQFEAAQLQAQQDQENRERLAQQEREAAEQIFQARREVERVEREKRESEERLRREQEAMEASLLRAQMEAMQMLNEKNMSDMKRANAEKDVLTEEHRIREEELRKKNEEELMNSRARAQAQMDDLTSTYNKTIEEKNKDLLNMKETMHKEKIEIMQTNEKEKNELQKKHLENLDEQQRKFLEQQNLTQEKIENETSALRSEASKREELLRDDKIKAEQEFQRQMRERELMTKEERTATEKRHAEYIKSKDAAINKLREETENRMDELHEANRVQQARDLATLQEIHHDRMEREKQVHAQQMEMQREGQEREARLHEQMLAEKDKSHAMLFLAMQQRQQDAHHYHQILSAVPRALASEQQTSKVMSLKTKLHEITSNTDDAIANFEMAHGDFTKKASPQNFAALEKSATDMNDCVKTLHRTVTETITQVDGCTSVIAATREKWRELLRHLQTLTSKFSRSSTQMLGLTKRKAVTIKAIDSLTNEFEEIKNQIYSLPNLDEGSVMGMIEQRQAEMVVNQQNLLMLNGAGNHQAILEAANL